MVDAMISSARTHDGEFLQQSLVRTVIAAIRAQTEAHATRRRRPNSPRSKPCSLCLYLNPGSRPVRAELALLADETASTGSAARSSRVASAPALVCAEPVLDTGRR